MLNASRISVSSAVVKLSFSNLISSSEVETVRPNRVNT